MGDIVAGGFDDTEEFAGVTAEVLFGGEDDFGEAADGGEGIIDIVGDTAGHLAEGTESLMLHDGLLGLLDFVVGVLEFGVEVGLVACEGDVFTEGAEELLFAWGEAVGGALADEEDAFELVIVAEGEGGAGAHAEFAELLEDWEGVFGGIGGEGGGCMVERPATGFGGDGPFFRLPVEECGFGVAFTGGFYAEGGVGVAGEEDGAEVGGEAVGEFSDGDLEDTLDILVGGDGLGDVVEQFGAGELLGEFLLSELPIVDFLAEVLGAFENFLFEFVVGLLEVEFASLDFGEHGIETIDEVTDFVIGMALESGGVVLVLGDLEGGLGELGDGFTDESFEAEGEEPTDEEAGEWDGEEEDEEFVLAALVFGFEGGLNGGEHFILDGISGGGIGGDFGDGLLEVGGGGADGGFELLEGLLVLLGGKGVEDEECDDEGAG